MFNSTIKSDKFVFFSPLLDNYLKQTTKVLRYFHILRNAVNFILIL